MAIFFFYTELLFNFATLSVAVSDKDLKDISPKCRFDFLLPLFFIFVFYFLKLFCSFVAALFFLFASNFWQFRCGFAKM